MGQFGREFGERARRLAVNVIRMCAGVPRNAAAWELTRQVVRSSNSICANLEEAQGAISNPDFVNKVNIARKEARETHMWLRNVHDSGLMTGATIEGLITEANEIVSILVASIRTLQRKNAETATKRRRSTRDSRLAIRDSEV